MHGASTHHDNRGGEHRKHIAGRSGDPSAMCVMGFRITGRAMGTGVRFFASICWFSTALGPEA